MSYYNMDYKLPYNWGEAPSSEITFFFNRWCFGSPELATTIHQVTR